MNVPRSVCVGVRALSVVVVASLVALGFPRSGAASETTSTVMLSYSVEHAQTAPIVDGVLDDPAWQDIEAQRLDWEVDLASTWAASADFDASFQAIWRDGTLYVSLRLHDDEVLARPLSPAGSDRLILEVEGPTPDDIRVYTVPVQAGSSLEDPDAPYVAWSTDGRICELSFETEAMYTDRHELLSNLIYVDLDPDESAQRIGWVPQGPPGMEPQLGSLVFAANLSSDSKLVTSWGMMKTLY